MWCWSFVYFGLWTMPSLSHFCVWNNTSSNHMQTLSKLHEINLRSMSDNGERTKFILFGAIAKGRWWVEDIRWLGTALPLWISHKACEIFTRYAHYTFVSCHRDLIFLRKNKLSTAVGGRFAKTWSICVEKWGIKNMSNNVAATAALLHASNTLHKCPLVFSHKTNTIC